VVATSSNYIGRRRSPTHPRSLNVPHGRLERGLYPEVLAAFGEVHAFVAS
jgi:hypothetical protein